MDGPLVLVFIVGCGRLGRHLAKSLDQDGHDVVAVDTDPKALDGLGPEFRGSRVAGNGADLGVLRRAGIQNATAVFAVTGEDNVNLMVAEAARIIFKIHRVLARFDDPEREETFRLLNVEGVCPALLAADAFRKAVREPDPPGTAH